MQYHLCWSLFFMLQAFRSSTLWKRDCSTGVSLWILENFYGQLFWRKSANGCFCTSNHKVNKYWASAELLFCMGHMVGWFLWRTSADLFRVCSLFIISRKHTNFFWWLTCRKQKLVQSKILQQGLYILIAGFW